MTSTCTAATKHNFYCVVKASLELINLPLIDILANHVKDVDLFNRINSCPNLLSGRNKLRTDQQKICYLTPPAVPDYKKFDVTLLYTLIRNLCHSLRPTQGWGNEPKTTDIQVGDDIERLRLFRNNYYAHAVSEAIPDTEFEILWRNLKSVINRIQSKTTCSVNYEQELTKIEHSKFNHKYLEKCELLLKALLRLQTEDKDEPDVVINGNDEVICGDPARFVAVLKPDSSCWSITWQKRRGKVTETIDTSTKKYSGSTNRKLVIQSVCKDDEGEYQVLLAHESNGDRYLKCGNTICLHVFGEVPYLNDLEVTTGDEGIIIHYEISGQSPGVQRIEWKKDGQVLDTNACRYVGGSINDSSLTIRLPTEEDKGKYSCIITNAMGSVSKDVMLDVPSVIISRHRTVRFGSKATITAVVSSIPSPEHVKWQKSKDGNNFKCIDITKPLYYGSNDIPFKPLLVIPKATFDDKLYYRLLVRNKIRENVSDTVYLNVTGSPPNITTSQETNIKKQFLRLIGCVSLYDDSPDILEVFWTKNGKKIDTLGSGGKLSEITIDDNQTLTINKVCPYDAGLYQLTAVNAVGSTSGEIVLGVPYVSFENIEAEDGSRCVFATIESIPTPCFVQWGFKGKNEERFTPIDVNADAYKGTLNTLPCPVLIVKNKNQFENNSYQIEVSNFLGNTIQILDDQNPPVNKSEKKTDVMKNPLYRAPGPGIKFAKLSNYLAEHFPNEKLQTMKNLLEASGKVENLAPLHLANSALECFRILREEMLFSPTDVVFMQFLCKEIKCEELYSRCIKYALENKALCFFERSSDNGCKNVQFHIQGELNDYTKEQIQRIVEVVSDILDCDVEEILVNGLRPSTSFYLVLSVKEAYIWKLPTINEEDRLRLIELNIDFLIVDEITITIKNQKGGHNSSVHKTEDFKVLTNPELTVADYSKFDSSSICDVSKPLSDNEMGAYKCNPDVYRAPDNRTNKQNSYRFFELCVRLAVHFPRENLDILKLLLLADGRVENIASLKTANLTMDVIILMVENSLLKENDVLFMQFLCKQTGCKELYERCADYALTQEMLCFFQSETENGFKDIRFHIKKDLLDYTRQKIEEIVKFVTKLLGCSKEEILLSGLLPSASFYLVLSVKNVTTWKLHHLNGKERLILTKFDIDFFIVDENTITLNSLEVCDVSKPLFDDAMGASKCTPDVNPAPEITLKLFELIKRILKIYNLKIKTLDIVKIKTKEEEEDCDGDSSLKTKTLLPKIESSEKDLLGSTMLTNHLRDNFEYFVAHMEAFPLCYHLLQDNIFHSTQFEEVLNKHRINRQEANRLLCTVLIGKEYTKEQLQNVWKACRKTNQGDLLPNIVKYK